ncbi:MAG: phage tail tape measure protein [Ruegeria sp.]|uniref:phage tail tape measure protein n=1 Tax=Ruegeria sp. TaxID=1879320 RepID=UPI00349EE3DB
MALGDLNIALILKLVDQATAPARSATNALRNIGAVSEQVGRKGMEWSNRQLEANRARKAALHSEAMGVVALGVSLLALTEPAIQAEKRLAEVSKVVEFQNENGLSLLQRDIRELVTSGGLVATAEGITDIVAAAGRMGVVDANLPDAQKRAELLEFATAASKMAVAFGISADEAGTTLARWRQNLSLSQQEAMILGDTVNLLGNTMATSEADILQVINRQGVVAKTAGLATDEIAALSATLLAAGASPEIAATGLKNFTNALTRGESATRRQSAVFDALGIDAVELAKRMQEDATGGILSVLEAFQDIEPYRRNSLIGDLFGEEAKGAITPLVDNTEMLRQALLKTADASQLVGLVEAEYQRQAATTHAQRTQFLEYLKGLSVVVGTVLLPQLNDLMATVAPVITMATEWAQAHPELIGMLFKLAGGLLALRLSTLAVRFAFIAVAGPVLHFIRAASWLLTKLPVVGRILAWVATGPIKWLLSAVALLGKAFIRLGVIVLANPIGAIIAAVAALAYVVYDNWDAIVSHVEDKIEAVRAAFDQDLLNGVLKVLAEFNPFTLAAEGAQGLAVYLMELVGIPDQIVAAFRDISLFETGVQLMQTLWDGMLSLIDQLVSSIGRKLASLKPQWLSDLQAWVGGGESGNLPGRDSGGPVRAGVPYLVGERSPEIFVPGVSGSILPGRVLKAAMAASALAGPAVAGAPTEAEIINSVDRRPVLSASAAAPQIIRQGDTISISIVPPPGTDEETIARMVARELNRRQDERRADLHDGVDY